MKVEFINVGDKKTSGPLTFRTVKALHKAIEEEANVTRDWSLEKAKEPFLWNIYYDYVILLGQVRVLEY